MIFIVISAAKWITGSGSTIHTMQIELSPKWVNDGWQMNKKNIEIVKMDIWRKFEYQGQLYYIEVFHFTDDTIQAFANKKPGKVQHLSEEFPIGIGRDNYDPTKAAIQAIENIQYQ